MVYEFKKIEQGMLKFWKDKKIFDKLRKKNKGKKKWSFIDGPITANNPMGVHHAWGRTFKDLFQRFKAMQGFDQRYQNGFDCQGLWVEVEVEKDLGFKTKKDIEKFGLANFSKACRARVDKFSKVQTEQSIRLGQWMDWDNSYYTHSDENIEAIWHFLKRCFEKGWLYKSYRVTQYCPRCETTLSQHEMADSYKEVTEDSIYVKFELEDEPGTFFLSWTTTPWTMPGHTQLYVKPGEDYVKVEVEKDGKKEKYIVAEACLEIVKEKYKVLEKFKAEKLVGKRYDPPFDFLKDADENYFRVDVADFVEIEQGSGVVHSAVMYGAEDYDRAQEQGLKGVHTVDQSGNLNERTGKFRGMFFKDADPHIIKDLEERGKLYSVEKTTHRYPHCWRCATATLGYANDAWFIKSDGVRKKMKEEAKKVYWQPKHVGILMQDWLDNMRDWNISRKRFYGLPLPFYVCKKCEETIVIESKKELRERAVDKAKVDKLKELHGPWIDEIKVKCKCGEVVERIPEIGDVWLDAGIVPFSTLKYFRDREYWKQWFPADLIVEMREQVRLWFYAILFMSVTLEGKTPYTGVMSYEKVMDEKGDPMHKSHGNAIWFDDAVEKIGADTMRLLYCLETPSNNLKFGFNVAKEPRSDLNILYNLSRLVENSYSNKVIKVEDKWILSRLNSVIKVVTEEMEKLHPNVAARALRDFWLDDLSRGYIQFVRDRLASEDKMAVATLKEVYVNLLQMLAPFVPFVTDSVWQELKKKGIVEEESVHLSSWPKAEAKRIDEKLEKDFENALAVVEKGLAGRDRAQIGLKWPLAKAVVSCEEKLSEGLQEIVKAQLNVKVLEFKRKGGLAVKLDTKMTPELESEGYARELSRQVQAFRKKLGLIRSDKIELGVFVDEKFSKVLEGQEKFIKARTNSKKISVFVDGKEKDEERFKNKNDFKIKNEKGVIGISVIK